MHTRSKSSSGLGEQHEASFTPRAASLSQLLRGLASANLAVGSTYALLARPLFRKVVGIPVSLCGPREDDDEPVTCLNSAGKVRERVTNAIQFKDLTLVLILSIDSSSIKLVFS